jgi:3-methyladenine DNA glycosylase AlkD
VAARAAAAPTAAQVQRALRAVATPARARALARFFKTGKGEYGEGDRFIGVATPDLRAVVRRHAGLPLPGIVRLLASPVHEDRSAALLILCERYRGADEAERARLVRFYLAHTARVNNWDLVDISAPRILGDHLLERPRGVLTRLARSPNLWERRIAVVATYAFLRRGECDDTLRLAERLLGDRHDLMHKAVGWMLRELGKRDPRALRGFLDAHAARMPRTMLRYALERLGPAERRRYLTAKSRAGGSPR